MSRMAPRWGWKKLKRKVVLTHFNSGHLEPLETLLGIRPNDEQLENLSVYTDHYLYLNEIQAPTSRERKAALMELEKHAQALADDMEKLDDLTKYNDLFRWYYTSYPHDASVEERYSQLHTDVRLLARIAERAREMMPPNRGGRPRNDILYDYIIDLADFFEEVTTNQLGSSGVIFNAGKTTIYSGDFFNFVQFCLKQINDHFGDSHSNQALGQSIKVAMKRRSRYLSPIEP